MTVDVYLCMSGEDTTVCVMVVGITKSLSKDRLCERFRLLSIIW